MVIQLKNGILALSIVASTAFTSSASAANLLEVYRLSIDNDPTYLAAEATSRSGQESISQARSVLLPQVNANYNISDSENVSQAGQQIFGGTAFPSSASTTNSNSDSWSISVNQEIYHHDSWIGLSQAQKQAEQSQLSFEAEKQSLIVRVAEAYFNVLAAEDGLVFALAEKESLSKELEQTKQRFEVGLIAITDVHETQARFDQSLANEIIAQNLLDNMFESLRLITGSYQQNLSKLKAVIPLTTPQPENISDWTKVAERSNINLLSNQLSVDIARQEIKRQTSGHYPSVDLTGSYSDNSSDGNSIGTDPLTGLPRNSSFTNGSTNQSVSIQVRIPIYSGGRTNSAVRRAQADFDKTSQDLVRIHRQIIRDTRSAYLGLIADISSVKAFTQVLISTESALEATKAGFDVGTRTMVDVLLSTTTLYNSKRNLARKRYDYVLNVLRLKQAAGILTEDDLRKVNNWLQ
jgi:outer membrane protein